MVDSDLQNKVSIDPAVCSAPIRLLPRWSLPFVFAQRRGDPWKVRRGRGALPVVPAAHHRAAGGGGRPLCRDRSAGQLLWRSARWEDLIINWIIESFSKRFTPLLKLLKNTFRDINMNRFYESSQCIHCESSTVNRGLISHSTCVCVSNTHIHRWNTEWGWAKKQFFNIFFSFSLMHTVYIHQHFLLGLRSALTALCSLSQRAAHKHSWLLEPRSPHVHHTAYSAAFQIALLQMPWKKYHEEAIDHRQHVWGLRKHRLWL